MSKILQAQKEYFNTFFSLQFLLTSSLSFDVVTKQYSLIFYNFDNLK